MKKIRESANQTSTTSDLYDLSRSVHANLIKLQPFVSMEKGALLRLAHKCIPLYFSGVIKLGDRDFQRRSRNVSHEPYAFRSICSKVRYASSSESLPASRLASHLRKRPLKTGNRFHNQFIGGLLKFRIPEVLTRKAFPKEC